MKKVLVCMLAVGIAATAANAATVRMNFAGDGNMKSVVVGESFEVEYWLDIPALPTSVAQYQFPLQAIAGDPITATGYSPNLAIGFGATDASFANNGYPAPLGNFTGFAIRFPVAGGGPLQGVTGSLLMGTATYVASAVGDYELAFDHDARFFIDAVGNDFAFNPGYASYPGSYFGYGNWGNPGVPGPLKRSPLMLHVDIPEPASLALLAFGGFAALRRRR